MTARERVASAWHAGSDHAADGTPFGGPLCNCDQVAGRMLPMLAGAWEQGRKQMSLNLIMNAGAAAPMIRNPYEEDRHVDQ